MLKTDTVNQIAYTLFQAERDVYEVKKFVDEYPELTVEVAYDVQDQLIKLKCDQEKTVRIGMKLGLTSKAKQQMMGVHEPSYGVLLQNMELLAAEPISLKPLIHPKIEPEIAFVFAKDLEGPVVTVAEVLQATDYVTPAMEIIDSRYLNFNFTLPDVIADNSSSSKYIMSDKKYSIRDVDLVKMGCIFKQNDEIFGTSTAGSIMGHPARAIAWMANKMLARGQKVRAGDVVLSGALTGSAVMQAGDEFTVSFDGMDELRVTVEG
ncbi:2-keto-4-pentenoate hydratase [Solibacillus sp. FSL H8-0538]|uniref:2-keto-4-pentenoate hydratase n=1 Tax=Solibacillus sp. FSL H8-0538 TaxID=2921400 RepID=UPI0030FBE7DE